MSERIIVKPDETIACPECGCEFALSEGIARQTIERYEEEYDALLAAERNSLGQQLQKQAQRDAAKRYNEQISALQGELQVGRQAAEQLKSQIAEARIRGAKEAREAVATEAAELKESLAEKESKLTEYRSQELELRRQQRELQTQRKELELQLQRRLDEERKQIEQQAGEDFRLREAEYKKKIEDAQRANESLKRKLEQGSQQLQGEVLELEIESLLRTVFPFDSVEAVRKGQRGADVLHTVRQRSGDSCGTIVWETKRAENWSNNWIPKLKDDQQQVGGELAVLVSAVFPAGIDEPMLLHEGVWLVTPALVKPMAEALRAALIEANRQKVIAAVKDEKMEAFYDYICSAQFAQKIRGTVDAYRQMREDLEKEKAAMQRLWKKREGQLERITLNVMGLCGDLQGVSGDALPQLDDIGMLTDQD